MKIIKEKNSEAEKFYKLGSEQFGKGNYADAIHYLSKAIELNPNHDGAYNNRALAREELGDKIGALKDLTKAIELNPNDVLVYVNRASTRYSSKDYFGAIDDLNKAIDINPSIAAYIRRAKAKNALGDFKGTKEDYLKAHELGYKGPSLLYKAE